MASFSLTVNNVFKQNGRVYVTWSDGTQTEFSSIEDAIEVRDSLDRETLKKLAIARYLRIDPTADNPSLIIGHSITYNDGSNNMVVVS